MKLPTLKVYTKSVYGKPYLYPNCDITKAIVQIKEGKTLAGRDVKTLRDVGFKVDVLQEDGTVI